jgi:hypothetical protein
MPKPPFLSIVVALFAFSSCSKSNSGPDATTWTFNGNTYKTTNSGYDSSTLLGALYGQDTAGNGIGITFNAHPNENGTYIITNGFLGAGYPTNKCGLSVTGNNSPIPIYISTGKPGDVVNVTISNGKLRATFSNISIENGKDTTTVSGTIIEFKYQ